MNEECLQKLIEVCVRYLLDPRLSEEKSQIVNQLSTGLSAIILKLSSAETVQTGAMMCATIESLLLCIPEKNYAVRVIPLIRTELFIREPSLVVALVLSQNYY